MKALQYAEREFDGYTYRQSFSFVPLRLYSVGPLASNRETIGDSFSWSPRCCAGSLFNPFSDLISPLFNHLFFCAGSLFNPLFNVLMLHTLLWFPCGYSPNAGVEVFPSCRESFGGQIPTKTALPKGNLYTQPALTTAKFRSF